MKLFNRKTDLDKAIEIVLYEMSQHNPDQQAYQEHLKTLERLMALKENDKPRFSPDTVLIVTGNLLGILVIVAYEQRHVWASKASAFLLKPKFTTNQ